MGVHRLAMGVALGMLCAPVPTAAQGCSVLPMDTNEVWFAALSEWGGPTLQRGGRVGFDVQGIVGLEWGASWGGYEAAEGGSETRIRAGTGAKTSPGRFCLYAEMRTIGYPFRDGFEMNYGTVREDAYEVGVGFGRVLVERGGLSLRWRVNGGAFYRVWDMNGRRLIFAPEDIYPEVVHRLDHSYHLSLGGGLAARWRALALAAGVGNRPRWGDDTLVYLTLGFRGVRLGG